MKLPASCFALLMASACAVFAFTLAPQKMVPEVQKGKYGFVDKTGKMVITPWFDSAAPFKHGLAGVDEGQVHGYIDRTGAYVWRSLE